MKSVALYLRLSIEDGDLKAGGKKAESNSISAQRQILIEYLKTSSELAVRPQAEYVDDGFSGTNFQRPQFQKMMEDIRSHRVDTVLVKDLSRFGRDYIEVGDYLEHIFPFLGVRMISVNDGYDSAAYYGKTIGMDLALRNLVYDYYSKDLSGKVKTGMRLRQNKGQYVNCVPFGYRRSETQKHQMVVDAPAAAIVREIFAQILSGRSTSQVAADLNQRGIPTPSQYKGTPSRTGLAPQWTHNAISSMIRNIKYTGVMVNHLRESRHLRDSNPARIPQKEWVVRENAHEAIISKEQWENANARLRNARKKETVSHSPCDRVFYCGYCGRKLQKTFGLDTYFYCASAKDTGNANCALIHLKKSETEKQLTAAFQNHNRAVPSSDRLERKDSCNHAQELFNLKKKISAYKAEKLKKYEAYRECQMPREQFLSFQEETQQIIEQLERRVAELEASEKSTEKVVPKENQRQPAFSDEDTVDGLYAAIERVTVFCDAKLEIAWKSDAIVS